MICKIYVSAARNADGIDLGNILEKSRSNNAKASVTGMLLHSGGNYFQVLEGPIESVGYIYTKILRDGRHSGIIQLLQYEIAERQFPDWTMAIRRLDDLRPEDQIEFATGLQAWSQDSIAPMVDIGVRGLVASFVRSM